MRKTFMIFGLIILVAAAAAWYFVTVRLDSVIESRVEKAATLAVGSHVEVGGVHTDLRAGELRVDQISVANPPGFKNAHAMKLDGLEAAIDYDSLEIKRIVINRPEFVIEEQGGTTNVQQLFEGMQSAPRDPAEPAGGEEPVIVIRHLRIAETRAAFESESLDRYTDLNVDAIEMHDLRGTPSELAQVIGREVLGELSSEAAVELLRAQARKKADDLGEKVGESLRSLLGDDTPDDGSN